VIAWPLSTLPTDTELDKWLECNGQAVNATLYPKLAVLMSNTPNYQGVFLRGYGSHIVITTIQYYIRLLPWEFYKEIL